MKYDPRLCSGAHLSGELAQFYADHTQTENAYRDCGRAGQDRNLNVVDSRVDDSATSGCPLDFRNGRSRGHAKKSAGPLTPSIHLESDPRSLFDGLQLLKTCQHSVELVILIKTDCLITRTISILISL